MWCKLELDPVILLGAEFGAVRSLGRLLLSVQGKPMRRRVPTYLLLALMIGDVTSQPRNSGSVSS